MSKPIKGNRYKECKACGTDFNVEDGRLTGIAIKRCPECGAVVHKRCWGSSSGICPACNKAAVPEPGTWRGPDLTRLGSFPRLEGKVQNSILGRGSLIVDGDRSYFQPDSKMSPKYSPGGAATGIIDKILDEDYSLEFLRWVEDDYIESWQARKSNGLVWWFSDSWMTDYIHRGITDQDGPAQVGL